MIETGISSRMPMDRACGGCRNRVTTTLVTPFILNHHHDQTSTPSPQLDSLSTGLSRPPSLNYHLSSLFSSSSPSHLSHLITFRAFNQSLSLPLSFVTRSCTHVLSRTPPAHWYLIRPSSDSRVYNVPHSSCLQACLQNERPCN